MAVENRIRCASACIVGALLLLSAGGADAQRGLPAGGGPTQPLAIGARAGFDWDERNWSVGGQVRLMLPSVPGLEFLPSADVYFLDGQKQWQINVDAAIQLFPIAYAGAGLAIARDSLPTSSGPTIENGYNLFIGINAPALRLPIMPFAEARWTTINRLVRPFRVVAGLNVPLGRRLTRRR
ncbi:hypothetical protein ACFL3B_01545 [Gemmatimonadota bacterium]